MRPAPFLFSLIHYIQRENSCQEGNKPPRTESPRSRLLAGTALFRSPSPLVGEGSAFIPRHKSVGALGFLEIKLLFVSIIGLFDLSSGNLGDFVINHVNFKTAVIQIAETGFDLSN